MKKIFSFIIFGFLLSISVAAQLGINTATPHSSAMLDVSSNTKGMLIPRMTTVQRNAVVNPAAGLLVFDLDKSTVYLFDGQKWQALLFTTSDSNLPPIPRSVADGAASDNLGVSVSISGDYAIVGAHLDDIGAKNDQGSAYIFVREQGVWKEQAKLIAADGAASDHFGQSVSISGDYAIVGAPNGGGSWFLQGAAYIYIRSGTTWSLQVKINAADGVIGDHFGTSVSIQGDYAVIGAPNDSDPYASIGSAYIFFRSGATWLQQAKLISSVPELNEYFGYSVSIDGDNVIIGGVYCDYGWLNAGIMYIFKRTGVTWTQVIRTYHFDRDADDYFGYSVGISGNYAIIGAPGVEDPPLTDHGAAYIYFFNGTNWAIQARLVAPVPESSTFFGISVCINGDYAIVGAYYTNAGVKLYQGCAYIYKRTGTTWSLVRKVDDGSGQTAGLFGNAVGVSGFSYIIGAIGKNGAKGEVSFLNIE
jgi:hypothetical protein